MHFKVLLLIPLFLIEVFVGHGQIISEFEGKVKITQLDGDNSSDSLIIKLPDGSLGIRDANSISDFQVLSISNDTIYLENGGFIILPENILDKNLSQGNYSPKVYFGNPIIPAYQSNEQVKLTALDAQSNDRFGISVAISGDYAIVGAKLDDNNGSYIGAAFIFKRSGGLWIQQDKLTPTNTESLANYGEKVSISGDYAIVGHYNDSDAAYLAGSAYIYKRSGESWILQSKLTASDAEGGEAFGSGVSISGDYAIVGASLDDDAGVFSGSAYIFKRNNDAWIQHQKIIANDANRQSYFGYSVSISDNWLIVGSPLDDDNEEDSGSAYLFVNSGDYWGEYLKFRASDPGEDDRFGYSVSISENNAIIGAYRNDDHGTNSGSAYIFEKSGIYWTEKTKLTASDASSSDLFGQSVSISGTHAIVGAFANALGGSAYLYSSYGGTWVEQAKLKSSDVNEGGQFGYSVFISGIHAIVGARFYNNGGAAYIY